MGPRKKRRGIGLSWGKRLEKKESGEKGRGEEKLKGSDFPVVHKRGGGGRKGDSCASQVTIVQQSALVENARLLEKEELRKTIANRNCHRKAMKSPKPSSSEKNGKKKREIELSPSDLSKEEM